MSETVRLASDRVVYSFSPEHLPAISVESGDRIIVETRDSYDRQVKEDMDIKHYLQEGRFRPNNPATGPIFVRDLAPGDGLDVTIERIGLGRTGYVAAVPGIGVLGDTEISPRVSRFEVREGGLWYEGRLRLPLRPMVGVIGVAPAAGDIPCLQLGYHGGNLDFNDVTDGTTVHLPARVAGGLLAIGDVHASMGFGEVHSGVNIDATVAILVRSRPEPGWDRPWFETADEVMTIGVEDHLEDAIRQATLGMVELLQQQLGLGYVEAITLAGSSVDVRLGQASTFGVKVSAYAALSRSVLG